MNSENGVGPKKKVGKVKVREISIYFRLVTKVITATRPRDRCARRQQGLCVCMCLCESVGMRLGQPPGVSYLHH